MADFRPETTVYLFESTGVDAENQPLFNSEGAKLGWYNSHRVFSFDNYSYQRENRQYIRVNAKAGDLRKCDMMAFRNSTWKWIFCNILSVEFINPNCTEITFQTDSFATFVEDIEWCECWIEREMQSQDWNGSVPSWNNTVPEGLEAGPIIRERLDNGTNTSFYGTTLIVLSALDQNAEPIVSVGSPEFGIPSACNKLTFVSDAAQGPLSSMLTKYAEKDMATAIAGIYLVPTQMYNEPTRTISITVPWKNLQGYEPINAKCLSSEFCSIILSNRQGSESHLNTEYYKSNTINFQIDNVKYDAGCGSMLYPVEYYGNDPRALGVCIECVAQIAWSTSGYYSYVSQNLGSIGSDLLSTAISQGFIGSALSGHPVAGAVTGGINSALAVMGKTVDTIPNPTYKYGGGQGSKLPYALSNIGYTISLAHPEVECLKSIDQFFSRFGYRTNRLKKPNIDTRPLWNYVKTAGGVVKGPFSYQDKLNIQRCLDNGVTLWHVPATTIGDYSNMAGNKE